MSDDRAPQIWMALDLAARDLAYGFADVLLEFCASLAGGA